MCPGFDPYVPRGPWWDVLGWESEWLDTLPLFDRQAYDDLYAEYRPLAREIARANARARPDAYYRVHEKAMKTTRNALERMGDIYGHTIVTLASGEQMPIKDVPPGSKVFAFDREDNHPSGQVWCGKDGSRWYTDHTLSTVWRVVDERTERWLMSYREKRQQDPTPEPVTRTTLDPLPRGEYLSLDPAPGLTLIRAPHGVGKTHWCDKRMRAYRRGITVANTAALAEFNAQRFGVESYREDVRAPKISTTINSLARIADRFDFVHVDEADQVLGYMHSGRVESPLSVFHKLFDALAGAAEAVVTSADLSDEVIDLFVEAYRRRAPDKPVRVIIIPPGDRGRHVKLVTFARAKELWHEHALAKAPGTLPSALGFTAKAPVAETAWGYGFERNDLKSLWVSAENSRYNVTLDRFHEPNILDGVGFLFFNPSIQSGVSIDQPVEKVFILHDKQDFEVETCVQMLMRFRNLADAEVVYGIKDFGVKETEFTDEHLEALCTGLATTTDEYLEALVPEYQQDRPVDEEFAKAWRISTRRVRRSFRYPPERLDEVLQEHGFDLVDARDEDGDSRGFNAVVKFAREVRAQEILDVTLDAETISPGEATTLSRAHQQADDEPQQLVKRELLDFYGVDELTPALVEMDRRGRFRRECRRHAFLWLYYHDPAILAWHDAQWTTGRQPSEYRHVYQRSKELAGFFGEACPIGLVRARDGWSGGTEGLFGRTTLGDPYRYLGARRVKNPDESLDFDFSMVYAYSRSYREKLLQDHKRTQERERWAKMIKKPR